LKSLRDHMLRAHRIEDIYSCKTCSASFKYLKECNDHQRDCHK
jgi:hypothetical protein